MVKQWYLELSQVALRKPHDDLQVPRSPGKPAGLCVKRAMHGSRISSMLSEKIEPNLVGSKSVLLLDLEPSWAFSPELVRSLFGKPFYHTLKLVGDPGILGSVLRRAEIDCIGESMVIWMLPCRANSMPRTRCAESRRTRQNAPVPRRAKDRKGSCLGCARKKREHRPGPRLPSLEGPCNASTCLG